MGGWGRAERRVFRNHFSKGMVASQTWEEASGYSGGGHGRRHRDRNQLKRVRREGRLVFRAAW
jgi:hypothetical protein